MDRADSPCTALRVLVVDDDADTRDTMALILKLLGYDAITARDGPSALSLATELRPHLVLLDLAMPHMDGWEVTRRPRCDPCTKQSRIITLSGYARGDDSRRSLDAGCDEHWAKPLSMEKLVHLLAAMQMNLNQSPAVAGGQPAASALPSA
jgi:CheY-like chemotaxis protein